jgi:hypothetical protein
MVAWAPLILLVVELSSTCTCGVSGKNGMRRSLISLCLLSRKASYEDNNEKGIE